MQLAGRPMRVAAPIALVAGFLLTTGSAVLSWFAFERCGYSIGGRVLVGAGTLGVVLSVVGLALRAGQLRDLPRVLGGLYAIRIVCAAAYFGCWTLGLWVWDLGQLRRTIAFFGSSYYWTKYVLAPWQELVIGAPTLFETFSTSALFLTPGLKWWAHALVAGGILLQAARVIASYNRRVARVLRLTAVGVALFCAAWGAVSALPVDCLDPQVWFVVLMESVNMVVPWAGFAFELALASELLAMRRDGRGGGGGVSGGGTSVRFGVGGRERVR